MRRVWILAVLAGCGEVLGLTTVTPPLDAPPDAVPDAPPPTIAPFGAPAPLAGQVLTAAEEDDPSLTGDMLELYFVRASDLYVAKRGSATDPWPGGVALVELNTGDTEVMPSVSRDGLTLYFSRSDGTQRDIFVTTRQTRADAWMSPTMLALDRNLTTSNEHAGWSSADGLQLLVESFPVPDGDHDVFLASRASTADAFTSVPLDGISTVGHEGAPWASDDGATITFESNRAGTMDVWEARRYGDGWVVGNHPELDSLEAIKTDGTPWLSPDGTTVVFSTSRDGNDQLYMATRASP